MLDLVLDISECLLCARSCNLPYLLVQGFGCGGSLGLHLGLPSCGNRASSSSYTGFHCGGLSSCGAQALELGRQ